MVLLDDVIEVLALAYLDRGLRLGVVRLERRGVGGALVDVDLLRHGAALDGTTQKAQRGSGITLGGQEEIDITMTASE